MTNQAQALADALVEELKEALIKADDITGLRVSKSLLSDLLRALEGDE